MDLGLRCFSALNKSALGASHVALSEELGLPVIGKRLFFNRGGSAELDECMLWRL